MTLALPTFPALLQRFFTQRLMQQKRVSAHTIKGATHHMHGQPELIENLVDLLVDWGKGLR